MANTWVLPIGFDKDLSIKVGDQLVIVYCTADSRKLCYVSGDKGLFSQELPWGDPGDPGKHAQGNGAQWPAGTAAVVTATKAGTVHYTSRGPNNSCSNSPNSNTSESAVDTMGGHSIQVG